VSLDCCSYLIPTEKFSLRMDPDLLPSLKVDFLELRPEQKEALRKEVDHAKAVAKLDTLTKVNPRRVLAACVGRQLVKTLMRGMRGEYLSIGADRAGEGPQNEFNVTVLRKVDMEDLIVSCLSQMIVSNYLASDRRQYSVFRRLMEWLCSETTGFDSRPWKAFLEALSTAGRIPELLEYSHQTTSWASTSNVKALVKPLYSALLRAAKRIAQQEVVPCVLVELRTPEARWENVERFCRQWTMSYKQFERTYLGPPNFTKLAAFNRESGEVDLVFVADAGEALQWGRQSDSTLSVIHSTHRCKGMFPWPLNHPIQSTAMDLQEVPGSIAVPPPEDYPKHAMEVYQLARGGVNASSGFLKLYEVLSTVSMNQLEGGVVVCLAEGTGSYLNLLLHLFPN